MSPALGSRIKQWWLPALLVAGLVLFFASGAHQAISWQTIALHYGQITAYTEANLALAAASFLLLYAVTVAFSLPVALPLTLTGGAIFGCPFMARLEDGFSRNAFSYLLALRLIPAAPFWVVNIVPALTRMPFRSYLAATFIGIAPGSAVFVSVGRGLDHVLAAGRTPDLEILGSPAILGSLAALGLLALMPVAWKKFIASRHKGDGS